MEENGKKIEIRIEKGILGTQIGNKFFPVKEIVTHVTPDLDAIAWRAIADHLGIFTGEKVSFEAMGHDGRIRGKTAEQLIGEGVIPIDICGGFLDHHPADKFPGKCATSLFYELVPSEMKNEKTDKFVEFVMARDTTKAQQPFDLSHIVKILATNNEDETVLGYTKETFTAWMSRNGSNPNKELFLKVFEEFAKGKKIPQNLLKYKKNVEENKFSNIPDLLQITTEKTRDIVRTILEEVYQNQVEFEAARELLKNAPKILLNSNPFGAQNKDFADKFLTYCVTDNKQFVKAALYEGFSIIITKNGKGQVGIFTQTNHSIPMQDIAKAIIAEEVGVSGAGGEKRWYYHKAAGSLLNGSRTMPLQIPTTLSLEGILENALRGIGIIEIITTVIRINNGWLPFCQGGKFACNPDKCTFYPWMASKCQETRELQNKNEANRNGIKIVYKNKELKRRPEKNRRKLDPIHQQ